MTRDINLRYVDETYDENDLLKTYKVHYPDDFNFGYDIVDDIAINDPQRRALVWCDDRGHEKTFTFADIKRMSDKTANYLTQHGVFTTIRASRGQDIFAACGLLSTAKSTSHI